MKTAKPSLQQRRLTGIDGLIAELDQGLRTALGAAPTAQRANPAGAAKAAELRPQERVESMRLMRVNHAGEIAAQALYQGQALTAKLPEVRDEMERAAAEENDHLAWCAERVAELGGQTSRLQPLWHAGSFAIGALAGLVGDKWSLGFVAETEKQVVKHLESHQQRIAEHDGKSQAILAQMKADEAAHGQAAIEAGGAELPEVVRWGMQQTSKIMTRLSYWL